MKDTNTNKQDNSVKVSTLCKVLLNNAKYTTHFINKADHKAIIEPWANSCKLIKKTAFAYYKAEAEQAEASVIAEAEKAVYTEIKRLIFLIGDIPTSDGKESTKLSAKVLFLDAVSLSVNHKGKQEIESLLKAREALKQAKAEYRKDCLTKEGFVINGINEAMKTAREKAITEANTSVEKLLAKANASVFTTTEAKQATFEKAFEICLRKAMLKQYNFTAEEAKAEKEAKKQEREANRGTKRGGKQVKAKAEPKKAEPKKAEPKKAEPKAEAKAEEKKAS